MNPAKETLYFFNEAYIVGGAVRDALLERPIKDLDLAVPASQDFARKVKQLASKLKAAVFPLDEENQVYRLIPKNKLCPQMDIAPFQGKDLTADLKRRDFTINAMGTRLTTDFKPKFNRSSGSFDLPVFKKENIYDPTGGLKDLKAGTIRMTSAKALREDPLRLLRAFRFSAELDFGLEKGTATSIKRSAALIKRSAPERIHDELLWILDTPQAHIHLEELYNAGLLTAIFPDLKAQRTCAEVYYGKGGVLKHTIAVVERLDHLLEDIGEYIPDWRRIQEFFAERSILKLTALLHDVAKPPCAKEINGRLRFFGHEEHGAVMTWRILEALRFSRTHMKTISRVIGHHLRPGNLASNDVISDRAVFRFFRTMGENTIPLLILSWADHASYITIPQLRSIKDKIKEKPFPIPKGGLPQNGIKKTLRFLQVLNLLFRIYVSKNIKLKTTRLIDGHDVIRVLKMKEGPGVGEILEKISLRQFEGKIKTRRQALAYLSSFRQKSPSTAK